MLSSIFESRVFDSNITKPEGGVGLLLGLFFLIGTGDGERVGDLDALPFPLEDDLLLDRDLPRLFDLDLEIRLLGEAPNLGFAGDSDLRRRGDLEADLDLLRGLLLLLLDLDFSFGFSIIGNGGGLGLRSTAAMFLGLSFMYFSFALKNSKSAFFSQPELSLGRSCDGGL